MTKVTYCLLGRAGCNIRFIWDEEGPGLAIQWSDQKDLVGQVIREGDPRMTPDEFKHFTEMLV